MQSARQPCVKPSCVKLEPAMQQSPTAARCGAENLRVVLEHATLYPNARSRMRQPFRSRLHPRRWEYSAAGTQVNVDRVPDSSKTRDQQCDACGNHIRSIEHRSDLIFDVTKLVNQGAAADSQDLCSLGSIAAAFFQCRKNRRPFHLRQPARFRKFSILIGCNAGWQMLGKDDIALTKQARALNRVTQLPDIPCPRVSK